MIYVLTRDWDGAEAGTRLYPEGGVYFYKTATESERWVSMDFVKNNPYLFREITAIEFLYHVKIIDGK